MLDPYLTKPQFSRLSEHFTYAEFTRSDTALRLGLTNDLPCELVHNAKATAAMLERIREFLGCPMAVTSGYRCLDLNRAIKSKDTSDHVQALACYFVCPPTPPLLIAQRLAAVVDELQIGQLIYEHTWIHVSVPVPVKPNNRILTVQPWGYSIGVCDVA
jgi:hypothetical protein